MPSFHLTQPGWLGLLVIPVALVISYPFLRRRPNVTWRNTKAMATVWSKNRGVTQHLLAVFFAAIMVLATLGTARPAYAATTDEKRSAVMLVLDVSTSMTATDVAPNRLEAAKAAVSQMIKDAPADLNIGLVTVAGNAKLVLTPSLERQQLLDAVQQLTPQPGGTATGEGIITATEALNSVAGFGSVDPLPARIFLVSDGKEEIKEGLRNTDVAIDMAKGAAYPVFTVKYGTDHGEIDGQPIRSDPATLANISQNTGGQTFLAATQAELQTALDSIPGAIGHKNAIVRFPIWTQLISFVFLVGASVAFLVNAKR